MQPTDRMGACGERHLRLVRGRGRQRDGGHRRDAAALRLASPGGACDRSRCAIRPRRQSALRERPQSIQQGPSTSLCRVIPHGMTAPAAPERLTRSAKPSPRPGWSAATNSSSRIGGDFALAIVDERTDARPACRRSDRRAQHRLSGDPAAAVVFGASSDVVGAHPRATPHDRAAGTLRLRVLSHGARSANRLPRASARASRAFRPARGWTCDDAALLADALRARTGAATVARASRPHFAPRCAPALAAYAGARRAAAPSLAAAPTARPSPALLGEVTEAPARTYSIGFDAAGYDEMEYARIAARHFGTDHHEYYVTPAGRRRRHSRSSPPPTTSRSATRRRSRPIYCARFARADGIERMLGGDGGDELFGGNARYAKQYQLALFSRLPRALRQCCRARCCWVTVGGVAHPAAAQGAGAMSSRRSCRCRRATKRYNLLERLGPENVFAADFLAHGRSQPPAGAADRGVRLGAGGKPHQPDARARPQVHAGRQRPAQGDAHLRRRRRRCGVPAAARIRRRFLGIASARLQAARHAVCATSSSRRCATFLPGEIIAKEKHGFGLPAGVWLRDYPAAARARRRFAGRPAQAPGSSATTCSTGCSTRRMREHAGYYGTLVWVLMMLELWFQTHAGRH